MDTQAVGETGVNISEDHKWSGVEEQDTQLYHGIEEQPGDEHHEADLDSRTEEVIESYDLSDETLHSVQNKATVKHTDFTDTITDDVDVALHHDDSVNSTEISHTDNIPISPSPEVHPEPEVEHDHTLDDGKAHLAGTELEDIVNLLESVPEVKRPTLEASVSDAEEIPDEY
jgi:hypothetical protein